MRQTALFSCILFALIACSGNTGPAPGLPVPEAKNKPAALHRIQLPDSSELFADSGSLVRISPGFNQHNREIFLDGEAVVKPRDFEPYPFVVHTRGLIIMVLKDSIPAVFLVSAFSRSPGEEVDLRQGRLQVSKSYHSQTDSATETISGGEMVMINTEIDLMEKETADSATLRRMKSLP